MKKRLTALILLFLMLTTSSCMRAGQFLELILCGAYAVPGMFQQDPKGGSLKSNVIEEDSEGRILFELTGRNVISGVRETALVICQHIDADYVYFYEDECYLYPGYTDADIDLLKTQNDWGLPLDRDKMTVRPNVISLDLCIMPDLLLTPQEAEEVLGKEMGIAVWDFQLLDVNPVGYALYWVCPEENPQECYLAIISPTRKVSFLAVTEGRLSPDAIAAFKRENGWFSGK